MTINSFFLYGHAWGWKTFTNPARYCPGQIKGAAIKGRVLCMTRSPPVSVWNEVSRNRLWREECVHVGLYGAGGKGGGQKVYKEKQSGRSWRESSSHTEHGQSVYLALCSVGTPSSRLFHGPPYLSLVLLLLPLPPLVRMLSLGSLQENTYTHTVNTHTQTYRCQTPALGLAGTSNCRRML